MRNRFAKFMVLLTFSCSSADATTILSVSDPTAIVLAGDGLVTYTSGSSFVGKDPNGMKIAVCGEWLLCGFAGVGPLVLDEPEIHLRYDFQTWIGTIKVPSHPTVEQFAKAMQEQARVTFRDFDTYLKKDQFWKEEVSKMAFLEGFQVVGYTAGKAQRCNVSIRLNRQDRKLEFWEPSCMDIKWVGTKVHVSTLPGVQIENVTQAFIQDTAQEKRYRQLESRVLGKVRALLPTFPESVAISATTAYSLVRVESEFNSEKVGGTVSIGIVMSGIKPTIIRLPDSI